MSAPALAGTPFSWHTTLRVIRVKGPRVRLRASVALERSRRLRRDQTEAERKLWMLLRDRRLGGVKFRRQHPVGKFIVDFCCLGPKLVVELDGGQHATRLSADEGRTKLLSARGCRRASIFGRPGAEEPRGRAGGNCGVPRRRPEGTMTPALPSEAVGSRHSGASPAHLRQSARQMSRWGKLKFWLFLVGCGMLALPAMLLVLVAPLISRDLALTVGVLWVVGADWWISRHPENGESWFFTPRIGDHSRDHTTNHNDPYNQS